MVEAAEVFAIQPALAAQRFEFCLGAIVLRAAPSPPRR
jgi:hypothetical protein